MGSTGECECDSRKPCMCSTESLAGGGRADADGRSPSGSAFMRRSACNFFQSSRRCLDFVASCSPPLSHVNPHALGAACETAVFSTLRALLVDTADIFSLTSSFFPEAPLSGPALLPRSFASIRFAEAEPAAGRPSFDRTHGDAPLWLCRGAAAAGCGLLPARRWRRLLPDVGVDRLRQLSAAN